MPCCPCRSCTTSTAPATRRRPATSWTAATPANFFERTGIAAASGPPADLLDNLTDTGTGNINRLTGVNLTFAQTTYPVPGVAAF